MSYTQPYTHGGTYNPGSSGLSQQDFIQQRSAGTLSAQNGGHNPRGSTNINDFQRQSTPTDYQGGLTNWTEGPFPSSDNNLTSALAPSLRNNTQASNTNFQWQQNPVYGQLAGGLSGMYQGQQSLLNGPQNAYSRNTLQNLAGQAYGALQSANQQTMRGAANANAGRGVVGSGIGGILGQSLGVQNSGAVANAAFNAYQQGQTQGLNEYNARSGVAQNLGNLVNSQDQRNAQTQQAQFTANESEKTAAYNTFKAAMDDYNTYNNQFIIPLSGTSGSKSVGDQTKMYMRATLQNKARTVQQLYQQFLRYGNLNNPSAGVNIAPTQYGQLGAAA